MTDSPPPVDDEAAHLSASRLAAYLDGVLHGPERLAVVTHLADCALCRSEVVELRRALASAARRPRHAWRVAAVAAVAAGAAFVLVPAPTRPVREAGAPASPTRVGHAVPVPDAEPGVSVVGPEHETVVDGPAPTLIWRSAGAGAIYRVTVQDSAGSVAWTDTVADTVATVRARPPLWRGRRYYWSVDARLADGHALSTGVRSFKVR